MFIIVYSQLPLKLFSSVLRCFWHWASHFFASPVSKKLGNRLSNIRLNATEFISFGLSAYLPLYRQLAKNPASQITVMLRKRRTSHLRLSSVRLFAKIELKIWTQLRLSRIFLSFLVVNLILLFVLGLLSARLIDTQHLFLRTTFRERLWSLQANSSNFVPNKTINVELVIYIYIYINLKKKTIQWKVVKNRTRASLSTSEKPGWERRVGMLKYL